MSELVRIGVFYDGNFFSHVSNYYAYHHPRRARISISYLHKLLCEEIARNEDVLPKSCRIVDAHYFRGRLPAAVAKARDVLYNERSFEDVLMNEGITTHYLPLTASGEKGIDVWLALEALEQTIFKKYDVVILITSDGDYLPLVRKLSALGAKVMVVGWDFEFVDQNGEKRVTKTSQALLQEATYPLLMNVAIDDPIKARLNSIDNLFVRKSETASDTSSKSRMSGAVTHLKDGYGFIKADQTGEEFFFHKNNLVKTNYDELDVGDILEFHPSMNEKGRCAIYVTLISSESSETDQSESDT